MYRNYVIKVFKLRNSELLNIKLSTGKPESGELILPTHNVRNNTRGIKIKVNQGFIKKNYEGLGR